MIRYARFTKAYAGHTAVADLSVEVPAGQVVALLGPNGSGKTTSIKAAAGLVRPSSGAVLLGPRAEPATAIAGRQLCSFLPQRVSFPDGLTGREVVEFYRRLRGVRLEATDRVLRFANLNGASARAVGTYSGGMTQRLGLAVAMLPQADILLLDEPTAALDPEGLAAFYALVDASRDAGRTVFFSSHQLGDVERLADLVIVLVGGRLAATLTTRELSQRLADGGVLRVRLAHARPEVLAHVRQMAPAASLVGDELLVPGPASTRLGALDAIRAAGGGIVALSADEARLDVLYRELVGGGS